DTRQWERRNRAGLEARQLAHLVRACDAGVGRACRACDLDGVAASVSRDEHDYEPVVAEADQRLDDLSGVATDGLRSIGGRRRLRGELLDPRLRSLRAQERGDTFDAFRPFHRVSVTADAVRPFLPGHPSSPLRETTNDPEGTLAHRADRSAVP